jgi:glycosyltransferase involved in cell wall biosynthesis
LVQIGRIDFAQKGQDIALSALEELPDIYTLSFIGNGDERRRLEELIVEKRLCKRATIVENMPRHDLYEYLKTFQVCIMPSRFEGFGLVAIEAYLLGMKVVVSDVDGLREVCDIVGDIYLFEKNCSQSLAKAIKQAASLNEMNTGIDNFTLNLDSCSKSHYQMYKTLCE